MIIAAIRLYEKRSSEARSFFARKHKTSKFVICTTVINEIENLPGLSSDERGKALKLVHDLCEGQIEEVDPSITKLSEELLNRVNEILIHTDDPRCATLNDMVLLALATSRGYRVVTIDYKTLHGIEWAIKRALLEFGCHYSSRLLTAPEWEL